MAFQFLTDEELMHQARIAGLQGAGAGQPAPVAQPQAGMVAPTTAGAVDPAAQRAKAGYDGGAESKMYADMLRGGQAMMAGKGPQGKTVGPSNIYVAPTWSEQAASAAEKLVGGYQMAQARKGTAGVAEKEAEAADAAAAVEQAEYDAEQTRLTKAAELAAQKEKNRQAERAADNKATLDWRNKQEARWAADREARAAAIEAKSAAKGYDVPKTAEERKNFIQGAKTAAETNNLVRNFKPEYVPPIELRAAGAGKLKEWYTRRFGEEEGTKAALWWADKEKMELEPRHEMFGSAFTKPEQEAYNATTFSWNDSPEFIQGQLQKRQLVEQAVAERAAATALKSNRDPDLVQMHFGDAVDVAQLIKDVDDGAYMDRVRARQEAYRETGSYDTPEASPEQAEQLQTLTEEEEELYKQFPHLRPNPDG